ncbi:hypothetical protein PBT88_09805 [Sphingomonas abietis]|uniref:Uncharacterized protein n=1 Tax=Sphingomonas abietis TaxID=3012344 RepID=A0ABY7NS48_9SPHN|nr:hypothetical protein [Sphingomonas abietis]WBO24364.1 hypothetical protein PBT88_09805 [Sphingomonas abietis]
MDTPVVGVHHRQEAATPEPIEAQAGKLQTTFIDFEEAADRIGRPGNERAERNGIAVALFILRQQGKGSRIGIPAVSIPLASAEDGGNGRQSCRIPTAGRGSVGSRPSVSSDMSMPTLPPACRWV